MTGPDNSTSSTRPISVAELLAKNGTIGAPPVGGRRRRRRGNADAVTVAELTGEIPIVTDEVPEEKAEPPKPPAEVRTAAVAGNGSAPVADRVDVSTDTSTDTDSTSDTETEADRETDTASDTDTDAKSDSDTGTDTDDDYADAVAEYSAHLESRDAEPEPVESRTQTSRERYAEEMSPDPFADDHADEDVLASALGLDDPADLDHRDAEEEEDDDEDDDDKLPSYLRSTQDPLFGGQTVADDLARRGADTDTDDTDLDTDDRDDEDYEDDEDDEDDEPAENTTSVVLRGAWIVGQCILAVAFGAGLFIAFDQLWMWNNIVALVLSVLVILGLVVGVRVVRKTEDIGSTLIAVAVGALVTLGPLALLQSG